jgi:hypothetical protein
MAEVTSRSQWGLVLFLVIATPATALAEVELPEWLMLDAEYRVQSLHIQPLDVNGTEPAAPRSPNSAYAWTWA